MVSKTYIYYDKAGNKKEGIKEHDVTGELLKRRNTTSPDYLKLKQPYYPLFVYGTLKQGGKLHDYLKDCPYLGEGYTQTNTYEMYTTGSGGFPIVFDKGKYIHNITGYIVGEVYVVSPLHILELDRVEQQGVLYERQMKKYVFLRDQPYTVGEKTHLPSVQCVMYTGVKDAWDTNTLAEQYMLTSMKSSGKIFDYYEFRTKRHSDQRFAA